jgi:phage baseplate assembly protein W
MARSDKYTSFKKKEFYSDFLINFDMNPITGTLARVTNEDSVKQSLKNLILTNRTERPYNPLFGSRISALLFDPLDAFTAQSLKEEITETVKAFEPRVVLNEVFVLPDEDNNGFVVNIIFSTINIPQETRIELFLQRVR